MQEIQSSPEDCRRLAQQFLRRTGMSPADFSRRIGYHFSTFYHFLAGTYKRGPGSKEAKICAAILDFLSNYREDEPDVFEGKLYDASNTRAMRDALQRLCEKACILLVYAPPGSGKTDLFRALAAEYTTPAVHLQRVYCRAGITPRYLMHRVATACGSVTGLPIERTIRNLRFENAGRRVVLYFDEAQHLDVNCFETVRELFDEMHWSLCFSGSHALDSVFAKWSGDLEQLERRVTDKVVLPAVSNEEVNGIIRSELPALNPVKVRALIESSYVNVRVNGSTQRYLSIGRVMANIRELQELLPEAADDLRPGELAEGTA